MKKSKEQVRKELGVDQPGYWFALDAKYNHKLYWSSKESVKSLYEKLKLRYPGSDGIHGWRRSQTDWRSVNGLVIYDRFGSKITLSERPEEIEVKLTDAGQQHWDAFMFYEVLDSYFYMKEIFESWGGHSKMTESREELTRLCRLFPANESA
jgi:hypothetical protein